MSVSMYQATVPVFVRGLRVVAETDSEICGSVARRRLVMVVFPAPDGLERTSISPRRAPGIDMASD